MKISIFGLGYVGVVSAAMLADMGHEVWGTDVIPEKVNLIKDGKPTIVEAGILELVEKGVSSGALNASHDVIEVLSGADIAIICVGTPNNHDGSHSYNAIEKTCSVIGQNIDQMADYPVVLLRSTVIPGATEDVVIRSLAANSELTLSQDFGVGFNPEFLREGNAVFDYLNPPFTIIGSDSAQTFEKISQVYNTLEAPIFSTEIKVAEMIKMVSNAYHALKVTFANEVGNICKAYDIDSHHVMDLFSQDTKLNISRAYLKPGFAFGGSCLPKDLKALLFMGKSASIELPILSSILPSNAFHIQHALDHIVNLENKNLAFLGISFKPGTDDLRFSAQLKLVEKLISLGYEIKIFDQNVSMSRLIGANKTYLEKTIPHISELLCENIQDTIEGADLIVIANREPVFSDLEQIITKNQKVVDLVRIFPESSNMMKNSNYFGLSW